MTMNNFSKSGANKKQKQKNPCDLYLTTLKSNNNNIFKKLRKVVRLHKTM